MTATVAIERQESRRGLAVLPPQITILSIIALAVLVAMTLLAIAVLQQAESTRRIIGFNNTDVARPFVQLQRETLRLLVLIERPAAEYDAKAFQLQRDLLESRFVVVRRASLEESIPQETRDRAVQLLADWPGISQILDRWQAARDDQTTTQDVIKALADLEFRVNDTEIRYQRFRGETLSEIAQSGQMLQTVLIVAIFLFVVFIVIVAYSTYRFIQQRQKAQEETRVAMAAEAAAREASHFKDQFLAVMSHELRTPLNAIIGFLGIMKMSKSLDERTEHMVDRARANAERLIALISDILDLSKIEAGKLELVPVALSPQALAEKWHSQIEVLSKQKGLTLSITAEDSLPKSIFMDEDAISKIATNLLSNAIKFTEKGGVTLTMRAESVKGIESTEGAEGLGVNGAKGDQLILTVKDTGIGIPAHMHKTIFESFRQVDSSNKRAYGGTGLGLAIVSQLCKAMAGSINVTSTMGEGSTFTVMLPLHKAPQIEKELVEAKVS